MIRSKDSLQNHILLEEEQEGFACDWFRGPMLPISYTNEFLDYVFGLKYPLEILTNPQRYERLYSSLAEILKNNQNNQEILFPNLDHSLDAVLRGIVTYHNQGKKLYRRWTQKINGKKRRLSVPNKPLQILLKEYVLPFILKMKVHPCAHGGEKGWSPKKSLQTHLPLKNVFSFDLENAFEQVEIIFVFDFFFKKLSYFKIYEEKRDVAGFLATLNTVRYPDHSGLPVGSPISMALFNRILFPVDNLFYKKANKKGMKYSRWVDDFIISSPEEKDLDNFLELLGIIQHDFSILADKTFFKQENPFYLLGHKLEKNKIIKISKKEGNLIRGNPLLGSMVNSYHPLARYIYDFS